MNTKLRFEKGSRSSEIAFMERIIDFLGKSREFDGLDKNIEKILPCTIENDLRDLVINFRIGIHRASLNIEIQQRDYSEFQKYRQIIIDYVSTYKPYIRYARLTDFLNAVRKGEVTVLKEGKLTSSRARALVFYTYDAKEDRIGNIFLYDLEALKNSQAILERHGDFRTNIKSKEENWGSAFLAIAPELIESCRIRTIKDLFNIVFPGLMSIKLK